jgi:hypothetical protein
VKKLLFAAGFLAIATPTAWAQAYVYPSAPYGYGYYNYAVPYVPQYTAPPGFYGFYGFDPTANRDEATMWSRPVKAFRRSPRYPRNPKHQLSIYESPCQTARRCIAYSVNSSALSSSDHNKSVRPFDFQEGSLADNGARPSDVRFASKSRHQNWLALRST